ncbi:hypothetical protein Q428_14585 [Fervidicella metallireducens AeB]|uniref:Mannosyl-glycoprotein endo-beta-N-acetylglucosamidase-like domain-containing protein n=1 Tax=Fervidicella metallireducens AeB TaxID=1403537 RepID=A0A017RRD4_9CLOT|nr:N-acetylglucosaminidase [Fervidicella metallireducens]EYE87207.1 hypothetical protein Q428_14585 [Fervidicella metallireducens AeB]
MESKVLKNCNERITQYGVSLEQALRKQMKTSAKILVKGKWASATQDMILKYLTPENYNSGVFKYQFLDLSESADVTKEELNNFLKGKGVLEAKGDIYLRASKKYKISEVYLAAHSALETGNGTSKLAIGVLIKGIKVYNMYGINALDRDPITYGSEFAYRMGWTTPEKAIEEGAKWISKQYINNPLYKQNTLYKMRWNPQAPGTHQYASDISWAINQTKSIKKMYDNFRNAALKFDIPRYK